MAAAARQVIELRPRDFAVLRVLSESDRPLHAGRVWHLAFAATEPYSGRRDAGMTRTLDRLERAGLVWGVYGRGTASGRTWTATTVGKATVEDGEPCGGPRHVTVREF